MKTISSNYKNEQEMEIDSQLSAHIKQVEAPPFLFTRIQQKIENETQNKVSPSLAWAFVIALFLIFSIDFAVIKMNSKNKQANLAESMSLMPTNQIY